MIFAQAVAEYGAIASMVAAAQHLAANTQTWVTEHTIESLIAVGVVVLSVLAFARLRGSGQ
jgi:hypothetical protein